MAEYALVDSSLVREVIVADAEFISAHGDEVKTQRGYPSGSWVLTPAKVGIGYKYGNAIFIAPAQSALALTAPAALSLSVSSVSAGDMTYQWKKGSDDLSGKTSASLSIDPSASGDSGSYSCVVTVSGQSLQSDATEVTVS
jgi:hypothetical protein